MVLFLLTLGFVNKTCQLTKYPLSTMAAMVIRLLQLKSKFHPEREDKTLYLRFFLKECKQEGEKDRETAKGRQRVAKFF